MYKFIILSKVIELGSFTKAAIELGYTQSSISQSIASLEGELSMKLIHRSRLGVKLTSEGQLIFPFIEQLIRDYEIVCEKEKEINGLENSIIRIGTISSISINWLPLLIKEFKKLYPKVEFVLKQGDYNSIRQ